MLEEYLGDPEVQTERTVLAATVDPRPFEHLAASGAGGRPGWPAEVLLRALLLQHRHGWHDRTLASQLRDNNRVRVLVGLPLGERSAPSRASLQGFRRRIVEAGLECELFGQQARVIHPLMEQVPAPAVVDCTPYVAAAGQRTIIGLLEDGMRQVYLAVRRVDAARAEELARRWPREGWHRRRFTPCSHGLERRRGRRRWQRCYRLAAKVLEAVADLEGCPGVASSAGILRRVMTERGPAGTGKPKDRLPNVREVEARLGRKGHGAHRRTWHGYKATVAIHQGLDLVTAVHVHPANRGDDEALVPVLDMATAFAGDQAQAETHVDTAYTSKRCRREASARHTVLVGPRRGARRRGRVPGGGRVARQRDRGLRCAVERVQANIVRHRGARRSWYLGRVKATYQLAMSAAAHNLVRLCKLLRAGIWKPAPATA